MMQKASCDNLQILLVTFKSWSGLGTELMKDAAEQPMPLKSKQEHVTTAAEGA